MNKKEIARRNAVLQRRYELNYFPKVKKALDGTISSLIAVIQNNGLDAGSKYLSEKTDTGTLPDVIEDLYLKVGLRFARMQHSEFLREKRQSKGFGFNEVWIEFIKNYLYRFLLDKITYEVGEYTRKVLLKTLETAYNEGWGVDETVRALKELPLSRTQAARIVRTETTRASNTGTMAAGSTFEFEQQKEWIAAMDMRTRGTDPEDHANHRKLDGTVIDYDAAFIDPRNGDKLMFPGDPKASAASTINCRCTIAITAKRDENGRLIPKK